MIKVGQQVYFNGTPKYLEDINNSLSFEQNLAEMFFNKNSGYFNELENSQFIKSYYSNPNNQKSKIKNYKLTDPFLRFY